MKALKAFADKNTAALVTVAIMLPLVFYAYGCESSCRSMLHPGEKVNRLELQAEVDYFIATTQARFAELDQQDAFKKAIFDQFLIVSETGTVNPQGIITALIGALGIGALTSNVKLRVKLNGAEKEKPNGPGKTPTSK